MITIRNEGKFGSGSKAFTAQNGQYVRCVEEAEQYLKVLKRVAEQVEEENAEKEKLRQEQVRAQEKLSPAPEDSESEESEESEEK